jgi:hypothetical protein
MRWTDLPPDHGPADAGGAVLSRGEWDDLRRRLERLPPGHPSRPGGEGEAQVQDGRAGQSLADRADDEGEAQAEDGRADQGQADRADDEGEAQARDGQADQARPGERGSPAWSGVMDSDAGRPREPGGHRERDAGPMIPGRREPYRPWFTAGESPEPWFADPDPPAGP